MFKDNILHFILIIAIAIIGIVFQYYYLNGAENSIQFSDNKTVTLENKLIVQKKLGKKKATVVSNKDNLDINKSRPAVKKNKEASLNSLAQMVYSGITEQQFLAIDQLSKHGIEAIQLLLYIINSNADITVKESAIVALSNIDHSVSNTLLISLHRMPELRDFLAGVGIVESAKIEYWSPYQRNIDLFNKDEYYEIKFLLASSDLEKRVNAVEQIGLLSDDNSIDLLHIIISLDKSRVVRKEALAIALQRFPEQSDLWLALMLKDTSMEIKNVAIEMLDHNNDNFERFIPAL
ncbi:MAG: HEAT repeat domain-containing protein, partial [Colwellia sp.]